MRQLEEENLKLKRLVADLSLDKAIWTRFRDRVNRWDGLNGYTFSGNRSLAAQPLPNPRDKHADMDFR